MAAGLLVAVLAAVLVGLVVQPLAVVAAGVLVAAAAAGVVAVATGWTAIRLRAPRRRAAPQPGRPTATLKTL